MYSVYISLGVEEACLEPSTVRCGGGGEAGEGGEGTS